MAEILKVYYPRYVELHNYVPASNLNTKKENWNTLNRKVLAKMDMKLSRDTIHQLANASQGAIEKLLLELRMRILRDDEEMHKLKAKVEEEKIGDSSTNGQLNSSAENSNKLKTDKKIIEINPSKFVRLKRGFLLVFSWIICLFYIWKIFSYCKLPRFGKYKRNELADIATEQIQDVHDETVHRAIYTQLKQELREKEEIICTLNHKIAYLESSMKLKDLRISSLTMQILQNAVEMEQSTSDDSRVKLRSRFHNFHETKSN
ncbi:sperm flagellar protein 1-like isoform X2 [Nylanderia fulva]|nr:sperm flagellar protein 1-like isoform X2 [Nylanderia fulva]